MAYISKIKIQDTAYEIIADKNTEKKTLATQEYSDAAAAAVKDELLNGAGDAYDTLKELGDLINENEDAIDALREIALNKENDIVIQDEEPEEAEEGDLWIDTSEEGNTEESEYIPLPVGATEGQVLTYTNGAWIGKTAAAGGVTSVNGQTGAVTIDIPTIDEIVNEVIAALPAAEEANF